MRRRTECRGEVETIRVARRLVLRHRCPHQNLAEFFCSLRYISGTYI
jgi:hypothetical protein